MLFCYRIVYWPKISLTQQSLLPKSKFLRIYFFLFPCSFFCLNRQTTWGPSWLIFLYNFPLSPKTAPSLKKNNFNYRERTNQCHVAIINNDSPNNAIISNYHTKKKLFVRYLIQKDILLPPLLSAIQGIIYCWSFPIWKRDFTSWTHFLLVPTTKEKI